MSSRRLRVLRVVEQLGPMTTEEIWLFLGQPDHGSIVGNLTSLERDGLLDYSPTTNRYELTRKAAMRRRKNDPTDPSSAGHDATSHAGVLGDEGESPASMVIAESSETTVAASTASAPSSASVVSLERAREALILEVDGSLGFALWALRNEPDLYEGLALAAEQGMAVPALIDVPRYRRVQVVADAVEAHQNRQIGGPCGACGAVVPPRTRWNRGGYLSSEEPSFHPRKANDGITALCSWCHDYLSAGHTLLDLREAVGNAIGGVAAAPGPGLRYRFAHKSIVPFAHEVGTYGLPWGHITPVQRRAIEMLVEKTVHPRRLILTTGASDRMSLPGLPARVHVAPHRGEYVAPVILRPEGMTPREEQEAMERFHDAERSQYLQTHPVPAQHGEDAEWEHADGWTALLERHERERKTPVLWRDRVGDAAPPQVERPAHQPPTVKRRQPASEALLSARQTSEREAYLARHPRPVQTGQEGPWKGAAGWTALLARHEQEQRDQTTSRGTTLHALEQRQASARDAYLAQNPRPHQDGVAWSGSDGWAALLASQEVERKRVARSMPVATSA